MAIPAKIYKVSASDHPSAWPGSDTTGHIAAHKIDVLYVNTRADSNFRMLRTGTDESVQHVVKQVTKHLCQGLYRLVSLNATEYSCVVVIATDKSTDELMFKNGFPWDRNDDSQPDIVL